LSPFKLLSDTICFLITGISNMLMPPISFTSNPELSVQHQNLMFHKSSGSNYVQTLVQVLKFWRYVTDIFVMFFCFSRCVLKYLWPKWYVVSSVFQKSMRDGKRNGVCYPTSIVCVWKFW
jgi:hypothetical protein